MATYEIGDASARMIYQALLYYQHEDDGDTDTLAPLLELFAPPEPPTAAELVEALRTVLAPAPTDYALIKDVLTRYDATREG
jgi:hypothetical protein